MKILDGEQASQLRMAELATEVSRCLNTVRGRRPGLTHTETASVLLDAAQRALYHQQRTQVRQTGDGLAGSAAVEPGDPAGAI